MSVRVVSLHTAVILGFTGRPHSTLKFEHLILGFTSSGQSAHFIIK